MTDETKAFVCQSCAAPLLHRERFCTACGTDMRWVARPERSMIRVPRGLGVSHFQVEADRAASRALAAAAPVQALVRYYLRRIAEPEYRNQLLGNAIKVSSTQVPRVHRLARLCERILHTAPVEVYVASTAEASIFSFGSGDTDVIVLTSGLLDYLKDDGQLLFVVGQQLGHVKADHVVYLTVAKALGTALKGIPALGTALSGAANFLLVPWQRTAALTADRAGLLCCQDLATAGRTLVRSTMGWGGSMRAVRIDEFLEQAHSLEERGDWGDTWKAVPALARRLRNLEKFHDSKEWARLFEAAWDPATPRFPCHYCPGGSAPASPKTVLRDLECEDCGRALLVDEVPCGHCAAPILVEAKQGLADVTCSSCKAPFLRPGVSVLSAAGTGAPGMTSSYQALGVHPTAPPARIRRAFRDLLGSLTDRVAGVGRGDPTTEKIRYYASFKRLIDPVRRADHDLRLSYARELAGSEGGVATSSCGACSAPVRGAHCGLCGAATSPEVAGQASAFSRLREALAAAATADQGEFQEDPTGPMHLAFHAGDRSFLFRRCLELDRPGPIRELFRAARDVVPALRPSVTPMFHAVVEGRVDQELFLQLWENETQERRHHFGSVILLQLQDGGGFSEWGPSSAGQCAKAHTSASAWLHAAMVSPNIGELQPEL